MRTKRLNSLLRLDYVHMVTEMVSHCRSESGSRPSRKAWELQSELFYARLVFAEEKMVEGDPINTLSPVNRFLPP